MICDFIKTESIIFELNGEDRDEVLAELTERIIYLSPVLKRNDVFMALVEREEKMSTLVAEYLAVPHAVSALISEPVVVLGISHKGVEFDLSVSSKDSNIAKLVFCIVFPEDKPGQHLQILKDILLLVKEPGFLNKVLSQEKCSEIVDIINETSKSTVF